MSNPSPILLALLSLGLSLANVRADGGIIRLRDARGPFVITIFTAGDPILDRPLDVSVLVQGRGTGEAVLDADVRFTLSPPDGPAMKPPDEFCGMSTVMMGLPGETNDPAIVRATRAQAANKLLYAAPLKLDAPGDWKLHVLVSHGIDSARLDCLLPVALGSDKLSGLFPYLLLPPLVVAVFAVNQGLRRQPLRKYSMRSYVQ